MRVLFLSDRLPHAAVAGGHMIIYQRISRLARRGHEVGLAAFCPPEDRPKAAALKSRLFELELLDPPQPRPPLRRAFDYCFGAVPPWYWPVRDARMRRCVGEMVERSHYDIVVAEFSLMGQYLYRNPHLPAVRKVISVHHSATLTCRKQMDLLGPSPEALRVWLRMKGLQGYEFRMYRSADQVLVLTPQERYWLLSSVPSLRIAVVPSGVDVEYFKPQDAAGTEPPAAKNVRDEPCILFTGNYMDEPNRDAVLWFTSAVWPLVRERRPDLKFYVVGPDPSAAMRALTHDDPRIIVTGRVEDLRPYFARAQVFICPVRIGTGMRGKILEAMASGVPVVSTTLGAEGIPAQMGDNCFLADQPDIMAGQIDLLLGDPALRASLSRRARDMVTERFSWDRSVELLEGIFAELPTRRA
ncbi:MAG: glycosyltransferase [Kiritimatiellae bacterium]|nr:glycosyltransferase [Kiritimatiellia bacterium]